jgi:1-acyl-sn-glycerol-3-phosphate acyltransferase
MPVKEYQVALWRRILRPIMMAVLRGLFNLLTSVKVAGTENVPLGQAYVAVLNHISTFDGPFVGAFWPEILEAVGAIEVWQRPGQQILAVLYGGIPVHRGDYDRAMIDRVLAALRSGRPLLIAPEGGRSHTPGMQRAKPGVAFILDEAQVPIVPVGVVGATDDFWQKASHLKRPHIEMHIGKPFRLPPIQGRGAERREARQCNADQVMAAIAALLPEEYCGVYSDAARDLEKGGN